MVWFCFVAEGRFVLGMALLSWDRTRHQSSRDSTWSSVTRISRMKLPIGTERSDSTNMDVMLRCGECYIP